MNVRQFAELFVRPFVKQRSISLAIGEYGLIGSINMALGIIYARNGSYQSWAVRTEGTLATPDEGCCEIKFKTQYPIARVTGMYFGPREIISTDAELCPCDCGTPSCSCACETSCGIDKLRSFKNHLVQPGAKLVEFGDYKIWGGGYGGGLFGNIVSINICGGGNNCCNFDTEGLYITYQAYYNMVKCYSDRIPLPDAFMPALGMYVVSLIKTNSGNWKASEDTYWRQIGDQMIDSISKLENNAPTEITMNKYKTDPRYGRLPNSL